MRLLLETKVWIWWLADAPELADSARRAIADPENDVFVSVVSVWEICEKFGRRIDIAGSPTKQLERWIARDGFHILPLDYGHVMQLMRLPQLPRDRFDQLIFAQAATQGMVVVTDHRAVFDRCHVGVMSARDQGSR